jgi:1-acyl-sn-glycerol-3-phosphate acyltransferase
MKRWRLYGRVVRLLLVVALGLAMAGVFSLYERLGLRNPTYRRQRWARFFMARLSNALPFKVHVQGEMPRAPMLWVGNHVSWTDIPVLGMLAPLSFLSKAEVRTWPVAGWLALKAGTLFIRRGAGDSQHIRRQMTQHLQSGHDLMIFPEGTTTDGRSLRTFHGRLLASAIDAGVPVLPIAIRYVRDGEADSIAPFVGEDDLLSHLLRLFEQERAEVRVQVLTPIASVGKERAALAYEAQEAVRMALFGEVEEVRRAA